MNKSNNSELNNNDEKETQFSFDDFELSASIKKALRDISFTTATPIQAQTIPALIEGRDLIGQSQTGTGKTASFCLPIIQKIDSTVRSIQAIIVCPTRELALQTTTKLREFTKFQDSIKCVTIYGGEPIDRQLRALRQGAKIVVGTPGRIIDHIKRKTIKLDNIKMVALDEADEMLDMGFEEDVKKILDVVPKERQTMLFSATMSDRIMKIANKYLTNPVTVKAEAKELTVDTINQTSIEVKQNEKMDMMMKVLNTLKPERAVVFCNTKRMVDKLLDIVTLHGFKSDVLHGDIKQSMRQRTMKRFKAGEFSILIATDVAARGIDVDDLELVINYDIPQKAEYYVHRIGRTGRNGKKGRAITLHTRKDYGQIKEIEKFAKTTIEIQKDFEIAPIVEKSQKSSGIEVTMKDKKSTTKKIQDVINRSKKIKYDDNNEILSNLLENNSLEEIASALIKIELMNTVAENTAPEKRIKPVEISAVKNSYKPSGNKRTNTSSNKKRNFYGNKNSKRKSKASK